MPKYRKFTQEYRDEAVLMVIQSQRPIAQVARELGINEGTRPSRRAISRTPAFWALSSATSSRSATSDLRCVAPTGQ